MKIPVPLRLAAVALGATAFYTWVGQKVPQKEVQPPEVVEIADDVGPAEMAAIGQEIFDGKGICSTCHKIGGSGPQRFPDLQGIATRAGTRIAGLNSLEYLAQSMYEPNVFIVEGFSPGMPAIDKPPIDLTDTEILAVIAYLQTLGGEATVTPETLHAYNGGGAPGEAPAGETADGTPEAAASEPAETAENPDAEDAA